MSRVPPAARDDRRVRPRVAAGLAALALLTASLGVSALRDWFILTHRAGGPPGVPHAASLLLHNALQGWTHAGISPVTQRYRAGSLWAAGLWEWLPALLFLGGLGCWICRDARRSSRLPRRSPRRLSGFAPGGAALVVFVAANLISLLAFKHAPHVQDSIAQLFQARIFADGRAWVPVPRLSEFVTLEFLVENAG